MITPQSFIDASNKERWERELKTAWLILYQGLIAMHHHPGKGENANAEKLAEMTDYYLEHFARRFPCPHSSQEPLSPAVPRSAQDYSADSAKQRQTDKTSNFNANSEIGKKE